MNVLTTQTSEIRVPLNRPRFKARRDFYGVAAGMGALLFLFIGGSISVLISDGMHKGYWLQEATPGLFLMCITCVCIIGSATWAGLQSVLEMTKILRRNLPALLINREGVVDNSSDYAVGKIRFMRLARSAGQKLLRSRLTYGGHANLIKIFPASPLS